MYQKITKLLALALLFTLFVFSAIAQDIIVLKNGDEIKSLVQEMFNEVAKPIETKEASVQESRGTTICVFSPPLARVENVLKAATAPSCRTLAETALAKLQH